MFLVYGFVFDCFVLLEIRFRGFGYCFFGVLKVS